jgi:threonine-phosphate decarboxylase
MNFPVDLGLFEGTRHSPSFLGLKKSMGEVEKELHDFCIPVNPYFPTAEMFDGFRSRLERVLKFYPAYNQSIADVLCETLSLDPETVVLGNGSTELITWINRLFIGESLAIPIPTFSRWTDDPLSTGKQVHMFPRLPENDFQLDWREFVAFIRAKGAKAAVLCNPNNPTGAFLPVADVVKLLDALSDLDLVVIDESFVDFVDESGVPSVAAEVVSRPNAIVLKSLGKNFGLHGVRAGYAVAHPKTASKLREALPFWNLNAMAEMLIRDLGANLVPYEKGRRQVVRDRSYLQRALATVEGLKVFPSKANFVYFRVPDRVSGVELRNALLTEHGLLTRECGNKVGSDSQHFRVAARPSLETDLLVRALRTEMHRL